MNRRHGVLSAMMKATVLMLALAMLLLAHTPPCAADQDTPPLPADAAWPPVTRPLLQPTATATEVVTTTLEASPSVVETSQPAGMLAPPGPTDVTPIPQPQETVISAGGAYRVHGSLTKTTRLAGRTLANELRIYEIGYEPVDDVGGRGFDRAFRISTSSTKSGSQTGAASIALYEIGNAAVIVAGPAHWRIQTRDTVTPLAQAMEPVLELARLAYAVCGDDASADPLTSDETNGGDGEDTGACLLNNSGRVADLMAAYDGSARVTSSQMAVQLDTQRGVVLRYLFSAEIEAPEPSTGSPLLRHSVEWSYEHEPVGGLSREDTTSFGVGWPAGVPRITEVTVPGLERGVLPAPDRVLAVEQAGAVLRLQMAMGESEARDEVLRLLRNAGWSVREIDGVLLASQGDESIVVDVDADVQAGSVYLEFVRIE